MNEQEFEKVYEQARQRALKKYLTEDSQQKMLEKFKKGVKNNDKSETDLLRALPVLTLQLSHDLDTIQEEVQHDIMKDLFVHSQINK